MKDYLEKILSNSIKSFREAVSSISSIFEPSEQYKKEMIEKELKIYNLNYNMLNELIDKNEKVIENLQEKETIIDDYWAKDIIIKSYMHKIYTINDYTDYSLIEDLLKKEIEGYKKLLIDTQKEIKSCCDRLEELGVYNEEEETEQEDIEVDDALQQFEKIGHLSGGISENDYDE